MAEVKHTAGPWQGCLHLRSDADETCGCGYRGGIWSTSADVMICEIGHGTEPGADMTPVSDRAVQIADACLIAAAPELLAALIEVEDVLSHSSANADCDLGILKLRAVIARATGAA